MARTLSTLVVKVTADTVEVRQAFDKLQDDVQKVGKGFLSLGTLASTAGNLIADAFSSVASSAISAVGNAVGLLSSQFLKGVKLSGDYNKAMVGLIGVSNAYGMSADAAMQAARSLSDDGLLTVGESAKGLKNLLQTGFGLKEATDIMNVFKDSAVNGRQANFSYADSIVTATEGIKNMLSRNVDNVGITKNLSVIMKEQGYIMSDLTDKVKGAGARQALYNGLLHEAAAAAGDAKRSLETYEGAMNVLDTSYKSALASVGDFVTLNKSTGVVLNEVAKWLREVTDWLLKNKKGYELVSDVVITAVKVFSEFLNIIDVVQQAFNNIVPYVTKFANAMIVVFQIVEKAEKFRAFLDPLAEISSGGGDYSKGLHSTNAKEAATAIEFLTKAVKDLEPATKDSADRAERWSGVIQGARARVDELEKKLELTKGQFIVLGDVARPAGDKMKEAADKAAISAKELAKDIAKLNHAFSLLLPAEKAHRDAVRARLEQTMKDSQAAQLELINLTKDPIPQLQGTLKSSTDFYTPLAKRQKEFFHELAEDMDQLGKQLKEKAAALAAANPFGKSFKQAFATFGADLPLALADAFVKGNSVALAAGESFANAFAGAYKKALEKVAAGGKFTASDILVGKISAAASGALAGVETGLATGSKTKGILSGAATGAAAGLPLAAVTGGLSVAIGAGAGALGGLFGGIFGGQKKAAEARAALQDAKKALLDQYGGMEKLKKQADLLGISIEKAFSAKTMTEFKAAMGDINGAFAEQQHRAESLGKAVEGVNKRALTLEEPFRAWIKVMQLGIQEDADAQAKIAGANAPAAMAEAAQRSQGAFETLGLVVRDTFAGLVRDSGSAISAITQLEPAFITLRDGISKFGFQSTAVIDELVANFNLLTSEAFKPLFDAIEADGEILKALFDAKALSPDAFQGLAADIGHSIQDIVDKGGDMQRTLALSQPVLQTLWEAQQKYGNVTDETTQKILKQAEEQGLIGAEFKDVNEKILDVLLAIAKVLKADIPDYFKGLVPAAETAATGVENAFNNIKPKVHVKVEVDDTTLPDGTTVPALAGGGIVRRRTLAIIGENGPEAVVPLTGNSSLGVSGGNYITDVYLDGERIARSTAKRMPSVLRGVGIS